MTGAEQVLPPSGPPSGAGTVVVTGASSGIGAAVADLLVGTGHEVVAVCRSRPATPATWIEGDLATASSRAEALDRLRRVAPDGILGVVHAAGLQHAHRLGSLDGDGFRAMWEVHVAAAADLVDRLVDRIVDGGRVVLLGSRTMAGVPGKSEYAATKAALPALARSWASELAPRGITVNVVAPGPTRTPMLADPRRTSVAPVMPPLGRLVEPAEVAAAVRYLLGPDAAMITGQTLVICGGASLGRPPS